jgi:hypothetical protein
MRFVLEVSADWDQETAVTELGRVLRYWGSNLNNVDLTAEIGQDVYDSEYNKVGRWTVEP